MVDIQALVSGLKASRKFADNVLTNVLVLPMELMKQAERIVWAKPEIPAAYILDGGAVAYYYFYADAEDGNSLSLPESLDKPLLAEFFYKENALQQLEAIDERLSGSSFEKSACFQRMSLKDPHISFTVPADHTLSTAPCAEEICSLWTHQIADKTNIPNIPECLDLIKQGLVYSIETEGHTAAAMMFEKSGRRYIVRHVAVSPQHRRKGLARSLLLSTLTTLPDGASVMLWVERNNTPAVKLYESLGFTADGMLSTQWEWCPDTNQKESR